MDRSYLVLDIETVPDQTLYNPPIVEPGAERPFPPLCMHRPIVIGALLLDGAYQLRRLGVFGEPRGARPTHGGERLVPAPSEEAERALLEDFSQFVERKRAHLVTFNGRGFDLPVLVLRCLRHGVALPWYYRERDYRYRFSEDGHLDLCDFLSEHGAASGRGLTLDTAAKLVGLPGKVGVDGSQVEGMYKAGRLDEIKNYCLADVVQTAFLFLRFRLLTGRLSLAEYQAAAGGLLLSLRGDERLRDVCDEIDEPRLLLGGASEVQPIVRPALSLVEAPAV
jgi:hypothetical protein